jgi:hypothetical protein
MLRVKEPYSGNRDCDGFGGHIFQVWSRRRHSRCRHARSWRHRPQSRTPTPAIGRTINTSPTAKRLRGNGCGRGPGSSSDQPRRYPRAQVNRMMSGQAIIRSHLNPLDRQGAIRIFARGSASRTMAKKTKRPLREGRWISKAPCEWPFQPIERIRWTALSIAQAPATIRPSMQPRHQPNSCHLR